MRLAHAALLAIPVFLGCAEETKRSSGGGSSAANADLFADQGDFINIWEDTTGYEEWASWIQGQGIDQWAGILNYELKLPADMKLVTGTCGTIPDLPPDFDTTNAYWVEPTGVALMCLEFLEELADIAYERYRADYSEDDAATYALNEAAGAWHFILLHEIGHGLKDYYDLNWYSEEDVVDTFAAVTLIKAGGSDLLAWAAYSFMTQSLQGSQNAFADVHSLPRQRSYDLACLLYGHSPEKYSYLLEDEALAERNQKNPCQAYYAEMDEYLSEDLADWLK